MGGGPGEPVAEAAAAAAVLPAGVVTFMRSDVEGSTRLWEGDEEGCARLRGVAHGGRTELSAAPRELVSDRLPDGASLRNLCSHRLVAGLADSWSSRVS